MMIKKFTARTFSEALALVKKELSEDAIILSTEEKKGLRPHVEVTAAVDYDAAEGGVQRSQFKVQSEQRKQSSELRTLNSELSSTPRPMRVTPYSMAPAIGDAADDLKSEINSLRLMIESMKNKCPCRQKSVQ
jgi:flagellar biosynthesis protein FlhF